MSPPLAIIDLGRRDYRATLELQRDLRAQRLAGTVAHDVLLLVEHDPVYTLGRGTRDSSLPVGAAALRATGADVVEIERGGDVTWHGPGQLVGYPILDLRGHREDLHWYLRTLEAATIAALAGVGLAAETVPGKTGVWTGGRKIASLGVHVRQWVTLHGFALNVDPDLAWFAHIVPCGLTGVEMTSVAAERGPRAGGWWDPVRAAVIGAFGEAFSRDPVDAATLDPTLADRSGTGHPSPHA